MKRIVALIVFAVIIAFSAGSSVAETNPLLTVFEAVEVGMDVGEVRDSLFSYNEGSKCYCYLEKTFNPKIYKAKWYDMAFIEYYNGRDTTIPLRRPTAELEVEVDTGGNPYSYYNKIVKITYRYKFFKLERDLIKK